MHRNDAAEPRRGTNGREPLPFLMPGARVGRYRIEQRLGVGAMSEVYLATDDSLGRPAAIKVLSVKSMSNPTITERFLREARALARLSHPNLIPVFEDGQVGSPPRPYYAMELLEGGDTQKLLEERGPLPSSIVAAVGAQAATGLGEAARAGIIHRDVKPANLGISRHGVLKVADFGLAKSYAADKSLTARGMVVGTADYIAPEQARGEELDERADVYSLGCTLYHLLTGHPPYRAPQGQAVKEYLEVMRMHLTAPVPDVREEMPDTDPDLADIVKAMMTKNRDARPTFDEIARRLARLAAKLDGELPRVTRELFMVSATTVAAPSSIEEMPVPRVSVWPRVAALAVIVAAVIALTLALGR
ncbi:MAG: serine/threonine protein kinase [Deltaproteobacteria bacterium]|nr:serine/threonine protein kinase [Deltaproteobacteria bacterium]